MEKKGEKKDKDMVYYCQDCLSLAILAVAPGICSCSECGSGNISKTTFKNWEAKKYKSNLINS